MIKHYHWMAVLAVQLPACVPSEGLDHTAESQQASSALGTGHSLYSGTLGMMTNSVAFGNAPDNWAPASKPLTVQAASAPVFAYYKPAGNGRTVVRWAKVTNPSDKNYYWVWVCSSPIICNKLGPLTTMCSRRWSTTPARSASIGSLRTTSAGSGRTQGDARG